MEDIDVQHLIGEVAKRHGVLLGPNDPILVTLTLNEQILAAQVERVRAMLEAAQDEISAGSAQQIAAAREIASRIITGAGTYVGDQVKAAGTDIQTIVRDTLREEVAIARAAATQANDARRSAWWAAFVAVGALCLALGMTIGHVLAR